MTHALSIIVPAYNEAETIASVVRQTLAVPSCHEVIVVDDGSTDGTAQALQPIADPRLRVIRHSENQGKSAAVRTAIPLCSGDVIAIQDADLEYDPNDLEPLLACFADPSVDAVYGSRYFRDGRLSLFFQWLQGLVTNAPRADRAPHPTRKGSKQSRLGQRAHRAVQQLATRAGPAREPPDGALVWHYYGVRFLTWLANWLFDLDITDEATCYKLVRTSLLKRMRFVGNRFEFCPELTAKLGAGRYRLVERPISYQRRTLHGGKKIRAVDGLVATWVLIRERVSSLVDSNYR